MFGPNDFNEQAKSFPEVTLQSPNTLSVELRGAPRGFPNPGGNRPGKSPPAVTIRSPSMEPSLMRALISVSGAVDDPYSSVTINGMPVSVAVDGSLTWKK